LHLARIPAPGNPVSTGSIAILKRRIRPLDRALGALEGAAAVQSFLSALKACA
jgi:hypothetical protein